jgi:hypothetical protein
MVPDHAEKLTTLLTSNLFNLFNFFNQRLREIEI